jgi:AraC-like DNA-binding protein/mannose-6-phosphate isomerase-like protein (cupin superfamily)
MTETPTSFAKAPFQGSSAPSPGADVLSDVLRAVRLTGAVFLSARFTAPFGILSPKRFDPGLPMAHLRHISVFHLIASGGCTIELASGQRRKVTAGDLILVPFADQHKFWNGDAEALTAVPAVLHKAPIDGVWMAGHGGGGAETRMVCGFIESSEFRTLPEMLVEHTGDQKLGALIASTVREILGLIDTAAPGTELMLGRLMELLFIEVLRLHAGRLPEGGTGWLSALNDPIVGRALQLVHGNPARKWTAADLAREAGTSRTVLAERFNALLGRPPIDYVTGWRIQLAADTLRNGRDSIAAIAANAGYESEAAFARAFKRVTGVSPGRWRDGEGDSPANMPLQMKTPLVA